MQCEGDTGSTSSSNINNNTNLATNSHSNSIFNVPDALDIENDVHNNNNSNSLNNNNNNNEETMALFSDETEKCLDVYATRSPSGSGSCGSGSPFGRIRKSSSRKSQPLTSNFTLGQAILGNIDKGKRSVELIWKDVHYSVESTSWNPWKPCGVIDKKHILYGLTGSISTGDITAVIGPSGAGKSSFLEILAGRREKGFTGDLLVKFTNQSDHLCPGSLSESPGSGNIFSDSMITPTTTSSGKMNGGGGGNLFTSKVSSKSNSNHVPVQQLSSSPSSSSSPDNMIKVAFMAQKDVFSPNLTVKETLVYASRLKNYSCQKVFYDQLKKLQQTDNDILAMSYRLKAEIENFHYNLAAEIMEELSLLSCAHVRVGKCSGGQQKRLSIACELVSHPDILILDEPTSGLDSFSAFQCVQLLRKLSKSKSLAVILSIHQPSSQTLALFDQLYVISHHGYNFYHGSASGLLPYLKEHGFTCPLYYNPADFITEIASGDMGSQALDRLIQLQFEHKKSSLTLDPPEVVTTTTTSTSTNSTVANSKSGTQSVTLNHSKSNDSNCVNCHSYNNGTIVRTVKLKKVLDRMMSQRLPLWYHTKILLLRSFLIMWREPMLASLSLFQHLFVGITMGVIFSNKSAQFDGCYKPQYTNPAHYTLQTLKEFQMEEIYTQQNVGFLFFSLIFLYLASMMMTVLTFPLEMGVFIKERTNRWYSCFSYYMARTIADTPFRIFFPIIYSIIIYKMTGQINDDFRFIYFVALNVLIAFVAQSKGLLIGSMYANRVDSAVFVAPLSIVPFLLFAGFFVHLESLPAYLRALPTISYFKYAFESSIVVIYGFDRCSRDPIPSANLSTSPFYDLHHAMKSLNFSLPNIIPVLEYELASRSLNDSLIDDLSLKIRRAHNATVEMFESLTTNSTETQLLPMDNSTSNSFILQHFNVNDDTLIPCVIALTIFFLVFRISSYFVLLYKSAPKK